MKITKKMNEKNVGYLFGFIAITIYAVINILSQNKNLTSKMNIYIYGLTFVIVKEFFAIISYFIMGKNPISKFKKIFKSFLNDKKGFLLSCVAGLTGGTLGFTLTTVGGIYVGSGLGSPIYSLETFIVMGVMYFLFKKTTSLLHILGILLTAFAAILMPIISLILNGVDDSKNAWLGIILLLLGVSCWSIESIIFDRLTINKKRDVATLVSVKQISSFLIGIIIVLPLFGAATTGVKEAYNEFGSIFHNNNSVLLYGSIAGVLLYIGRFLFFNSLKVVGATTANTIYSLLALAQVPLSYIANALKESSNKIDYVGDINHAIFWPLMALMVLGIFISYYAQTREHGKRI